MSKAGESLLRGAREALDYARAAREGCVAYVSDRKALYAEELSEVFSRKRPLTINMIRRLNKEMRIPAEVLIRPYDVEKMIEA